jgi:hypothetical protein
MNAPGVDGLLAEVAARGGRLLRRGEGLRVEAPVPLPPELVERLRAHKAELLALVPPVGQGEPLADPTTPCPACGCGGYWHAADGWRCEGCAPAPPGVTRWRHVSGGTVAPMPAPALPWPPEMADDLRRVAGHYGWSRADIADFCRWARRSPEALADAAASLSAWAAELPA